MAVGRREFVRQTGRVLTVAGLLPLTSQCQKTADKRPNILLFFPDQYHPDWIGLLGKYPVRTPHLDMVAKNGILFSNAICPSPLCAPSRSCLASGKEYDRAGCPTNGDNYPVEQTTFYKLLRESGYHVLGCGKFDLRKPAESWGRDGKQMVDGVSYMVLWGFSDGIDNSGKHDGPRAYAKGKVCPYFDYLERRNLAQVHMDDFARRPYPNYENTSPTPLPDDAYADNFIARNGLKLLAQAPPDKPWFLQVNFNGPHEPMDVTASMQKGWQGVGFPQPHRHNKFSSAKNNAIRQNYAAMIENIDRWLGIYKEEIQKRGELDNTIIIFSADHGEMLGDHNLWEKSLPYRPSVGVPLVFSGPGIQKNKVLEVPTTNLDIAATCLDFAGVSIPADMDSRSMKGVLGGDDNACRKIVRSGLYDWRMVQDRQYKLIKNFRIPKQKMYKKWALFDLVNDPFEDKDISSTHPEIVQELSRHILSG